MAAATRRADGFRTGRWRVLLALQLLCGGPGLALAQDMAVPVEIQWSLFSRIVLFDRNFPARVGDEIVLGIVYQRTFRASLNGMNALTKVVESESLIAIDDIPVRLAAIDVNQDGALERALHGGNIDLLYVTPLRGFDLNQITSLSRAHQITTLTGVPEYVIKDGVAVGIGMRGNRPQILVNLPASEAEGANFNSQLLRLARSIR